MENTEKSVEEIIEHLERTRQFDVDVLSDPETIELKPEKMDYLRKKLINKIKTCIANHKAKKLINKLVKNGALRIDEMKGLENFDNISGGAILTCNHFSWMDCFINQKIFEKVQRKHQKFWKVIREGNYTNPPAFKFLFQNCDTLPLSQNKRTMMNFLRSVNTVLKRGDFVSIYPEESMWPDYKKPKPLKDGAFRFARNNNVPVVPIFITFRDSKDIVQDGKPIQIYTVHVSKPIYPNRELDTKTDIARMREENYSAWVEIYESVYNKKLEYLEQD